MYDPRAPVPNLIQAAAEVDNSAPPNYLSYKSPQTLLAPAVNPGGYGYPSQDVLDQAARGVSFGPAARNFMVTPSGQPIKIAPNAGFGQPAYRPNAFGPQFMAPIPTIPVTKNPFQPQNTPTALARESAAENQVNIQRDQQAQQDAITFPYVLRGAEKYGDVQLPAQAPQIQGAKQLHDYIIETSPHHYINSTALYMQQMRGQVQAPQDVPSAPSVTTGGQQ